MDLSALLRSRFINENQSFFKNDFAPERSPTVGFVVLRGLTFKVRFFQFHESIAGLESIV